MFTVFGTSGTLFKGPMEELQRVSSVLGLARARRIDALREHQEQVDEQPFAGRSAQPQRGAGHALGQQARHEYSRVQQPPVPARHPLQTVRDVMTVHVTVLPETADVRQGWQALLDAGVGQAPVVNGQGQLVGLLTRAELLKLDRLPAPDQAALVWHALLMQPLAEVMISPVTAVSPETDIRRVARVLLDNQLPGLPVVGADEKLLGFVARSDILKAVVHDPPLDLWS
jgi:CBS domain-containing protein